MRIPNGLAGTPHQTPLRVRGVNFSHPSIAEETGVSRTSLPSRVPPESHVNMLEYAYYPRFPQYQLSSSSVLLLSIPQHRYTSLMHNSEVHAYANTLCPNVTLRSLCEEIDVRYAARNERFSSSFDGYNPDGITNIGQCPRYLNTALVDVPSKHHVKNSSSLLRRLFE